MAIAKKILVVLLLLSLALTLSGCGGECKVDDDCEKEHFTGSCVDKKCEFKPIPGECGNGKCETEKNSKFNENECECSSDCGECKGTLGKYMVKNCVDKKCVVDLPSEKQSPTVYTADETNAGDKIRIETEFPSPFNVKRDFVKLTFYLSQKNNFNHVLKNIELTGVSPEKRTVVLAQKSVKRPIWDIGKDNEVTEELVLDFTTKDKEGEFKDLEVVFTLDYDIKTGAKFYPKTQSVKSKYKNLKFTWVNPDTVYLCPSCEQRAGFTAVCGQQTNFFCTYQPVSGQCGNTICDSNENKCTCPKDCGLCKGETNFLEAGCANNNCLYKLKSNVVQEDVNKLDDRKLQAFSMANNYKYKKPFNIKKDKFAITFNVVEQKPDVKDGKIETVRLMEGNEQLASVQPDAALGVNKPVNVELSIVSLAVKEEEKSLSLRVDYAYTKGVQAEKESYTYSVEKIAVLNPDG